MSSRAFISTLGLAALSFLLAAKGLPKIRRLGPVRYIDCSDWTTALSPNEYVAIYYFRERNTNTVYHFGIKDTDIVEHKFGRSKIRKIFRITPEGPIEVHELNDNIKVYRKPINQWGELVSSEIIVEPPEIIVTWRKMEEI